MSAFDWERFLRRWSQVVLESMAEDQLAKMPQEVIDSGWLGYPGATEAQITQAESRLGVRFPPSYREFLRVTNGWQQTTPFIRRLWSTEGIERFAVRHQKWIEAFTHHHENTPISFDQEVDLDALWDLPTVTDAEYFVYGEDQDCSKLRVEYLNTAIAISDVGDAAIYLLNPQVVTATGEWEAWFFCDLLPGADRYPSFRDMMEAEYHNFLELRDAVSQHSASFPVNPSETTTASLAPAAGGESAEVEAGVWRSLRRLIIEFQTREVGERSEYRTVTAAEGDTTSAWAGLGERKLRQWLQAQLNPGILHSPAQHSPDGEVMTTATADVAPSEPPAPTAAEPPQITLEIEQLAIRQDPSLPATILVQPAILKQTRRTGYAPLYSQQPFSLEVVFKLVGSRLSDLQTRPATYRVQVHAQNHTTGQWIALGETRPDHLLSDRCTYTAYLFGNTLAPGMYRLQVLTLLRGSVTALKTFELPLLNVVNVVPSRG
jgi:hypothetical protein